MKIVVNNCYGGFSLSEEGMLLYADIKGITLYPEQSKYGSTTYWTVPPQDRLPTIEGSDWHKLSHDEKLAYNTAYSEQTIYYGEIPRDDPALITVVETLGPRANGKCANLAIVEIPDGTEWILEEYDGTEWVAERHETWYP